MGTISYIPRGLGVQRSLVSHPIMISLTCMMGYYCVAGVSQDVVDFRQLMSGGKGIPGLPKLDPNRVVRPACNAIGFKH